MYLADSNLVINAFTYYPRDVFPSYWGTLEDQIKTGNLLFHEKVYAEILPRNDSKSQWLASMVAPTNCVKIDDNEVIAYKALTEWTREKRKKPFKEDAIRKFLKAADSWLVACGKARNFTLVSNEKVSQNGSQK